MELLGVELQACALRIQMHSHHPARSSVGFRVFKFHYICSGFLLKPFYRNFSLKIGILFNYFLWLLPEKCSALEFPI